MIFGGVIEHWDDYYNKIITQLRTGFMSEVSNVKRSRQHSPTNILYSLLLHSSRQKQTHFSPRLSSAFFMSEVACKKDWNNLLNLKENCLSKILYVQSEKWLNLSDKCCTVKTFNISVSAVVNLSYKPPVCRVGKVTLKM